MKISIIIPVYNGGDKLKHCLKSVSSVDEYHEIIVVDDGSTDNAVHYAYQYDATVILTEVRNGPASARNLGAQHASGDVLFFIDGDVTLHPSTINQLKRTLSDPNIAAVIGSYDDEPYERNFLSQYRNLLHHFVHQNGQSEASTFWGACGAIRQHVFHAVAGFNAEQYTKPSIEDIELGYRIKAAGYRICLNKEMQVKHLKRWDTRRMIKTDFYERAIPWTQLLQKQDTVVNDLNISTTGRISVALVAMLLGSIIISIIWPKIMIIFAISVSLLLWLNRDLYLFFMRKRGSLFMLRSILWHWIYYFYSGLAYLLVHSLNFWENRTKRIVTYVKSERSIE